MITPSYTHTINIQIYYKYSLFNLKATSNQNIKIVYAYYVLLNSYL